MNPWFHEPLDPRDFKMLMELLCGTRAVPLVGNSDLSNWKAHDALVAFGLFQIGFNMRDPIWMTIFFDKMKVLVEYHKNHILSKNTQPLKLEDMFDVHDNKYKNLLQQFHKFSYFSLMSIGEMLETPAKWNSVEPRKVVWHMWYLTANLRKEVLVDVPVVAGGAGGATRTWADVVASPSKNVSVVAGGAVVASPGPRKTTWADVVASRPKPRS